MDEPVVAARRLGLLASAVAGRRMQVAMGEPGSLSWTDCLTIYLDPQLDATPARQAVAVQAALIAARSLQPEIIESLRRRSELCPRYLAVEGHRALAMVESILPSAAVSLLGRAVPSGSAEESLAIARSDVPLAAPPLVFGQIRARHVRHAVPPDSPRSAEVASRARRPGESLDREPDVDDDRGSSVDLSSPVGGGGMIGRLLGRLTSIGRSASGAPPGHAAATHVARQGVASGKRAARGASGDPVGRSADLAPAPQTFPEWDCQRGVYRANWCTVRERAAPAAEHALAVDGRRALRQALGRVMPDLERVRRQLQGDELDIDAAISERVDLLAGVSPDEAVYVDSIRRRRDLAVLVLLDVSASAAEPGATGGSVHEYQRATAAALAMTLHELGDRVAVNAFRSMGRDNVEIVRIKRFDEPADETMLRRVAALVPGAYTRLGAAIRHGCATLDREAGTARRLLIVVSDGFAYDHGYEGRYGEADARRALAEARRGEVGCLCLSVGASTDPTALTRVFGSAAHASLADVGELSGIAARLFPAALRSAEHRRRAWQHRSRSRQRQELDRRTA